MLQLNRRNKRESLSHTHETTENQVKSRRKVKNNWTPVTIPVTLYASAVKQRVQQAHSVSLLVKRLLCVQHRMSDAIEWRSTTKSTSFERKRDLEPARAQATMTKTDRRRLQCRWRNSIAKGAKQQHSKCTNRAESSNTNNNTQHFNRPETKWNSLLFFFT